MLLRLDHAAKFHSVAIQSQLSRRIRLLTPTEWHELGTLWMAFNSIYGGEVAQGAR
jgi:hypothetical protein